MGVRKCLNLNDVFMEISSSLPLEYPQCPFHPLKLTWCVFQPALGCKHTQIIAAIIFPPFCIFFLLLRWKKNKRVKKSVFFVGTWLPKDGCHLKAVWLPKGVSNFCFFVPFFFSFNLFFVFFVHIALAFANQALLGFVVSFYN